MWRAINYYGGESGLIPAAPLIHSYSPQMETVSASLALKRSQQPLTINSTTYHIQRFLTVQLLNNAFLNDENGFFMPNVKPHYAIAPVNGFGNLYRGCCPRAIYVDGHNLCKSNEKNQTVVVHDGLLSPPNNIVALHFWLMNAVKENSNFFATSYIIDEKKKANLHYRALLAKLGRTFCFPIRDRVIGGKNSRKFNIFRLHYRVFAAF
ncbi:hypothetical protein [Legionella feeleii]|uniref:Uncharacterized protein n=1 Tax=Legionella feeleii TaxID=453 RepID=A0A378J3C0_9GAMM|nr:hypothetical protein [Legionella feeleii]STX38794.1 Uncharacterised protein [Legionella feeleii]